jgi:hypothetical protein
VELNDNLLALSLKGYRAELQNPLGYGPGIIHAHHNASGLILGIKVVECDLVDDGRLVDGAALELRVSDILSGAIVDSEYVGAAALLVFIAEAGPVAQVRVNLESLLIILFHYGQVVALRVIVAIQGYSFEV